MLFSFSKSHKSPVDIVRTLRENLALLETAQQQQEQDKRTEKPAPAGLPHSYSSPALFSSQAAAHKQQQQHHHHLQQHLQQQHHQQHLQQHYKEDQQEQQQQQKQEQQKQEKEQQQQQQQHHSANRFFRHSIPNLRSESHPPEQHSSRRLWAKRPSLKPGKDSAELRAFSGVGGGSSGASAASASEEVSRSLSAMKEVLCGAGDREPQADAVALLAQELHTSGLLTTLVANLQRIDFEGKKDVAQIFNNILRRQIGSRTPTVEYISSCPHLLSTLLRGYDCVDIALHTGAMLRECVRHELLARSVLTSPHFFRLFHYVDASTFDVASDAFATFRDLLTRHKALCAEFLDQNYERVFEEYDKLLLSSNYVTKRQSLKLLGELLLERHNFAVMTRYISQPEHLKLMMNLLRDSSRNIQFEAFHVFKVFVANPNKAPPILDILLKNQAKLVEFLAAFQVDRTEDEQFRDEKAYLGKQIRDLKRPTSPAEAT
uniref:Calcium-binding protein 39-like isoform X1 n=1 Tax=Petromyzon marinus TaxID=7757 RepID=A0AAJ7XHW7_PETMA|nr:calcium-binding protein 39-like isoform X1 [Petromyzon marinus]